MKGSDWRSPAGPAPFAVGPGVARIIRGGEPPVRVIETPVFRFAG